MRIIDKILLVMLAVLTILMSVFMVLLSLDVAMPLSDYELSIICYCVAGVMTVISFRMFFAIGSGKRGAQKPNGALVQRTDIGSAFISLSAINAMVQKQVKANKQVRDCASEVYTKDEDGVFIRLKLQLMPDTKIVELSAELQSQLKSYIESMSGITVLDIEILVEASNTANQGRVD